MEHVMTNNLKVLVADDSLSYRMIIQELLEENQYEVQVAEDGIEALQKMDEELPDLILMDIIMPNMDGIELCQRVRDDEKTRSIPVIMLTAKDESEDKIFGLETGADDYLTKPFNDEELLAKIRSLLRLKVLQGELGQQWSHQNTVVLVADDSMTVREELADLLEKSGKVTILAQDGVEALELVNRHLPELVVLDVVMPGMDGIEVCRQIKENPATQQIPVVIITSKVDTDEKIRGLNAGADDFLFKPYNEREFTAKVEALFRTKKMQLEAERNVLAKTNFELQKTNQKLRDAQTQLVQQEKMASLGQLVAGVAHEINNPLAFVISNSKIFSQSFEDYHLLLKAYQNLRPVLQEAGKLQEIVAIEDEIDLAYLMEQIPHLNKDVEEGLERIRQIVLALRNFSRLDEAEQKRANLIEGLESTLNLLQHQLKNRIKIVKNFEKIPEIDCFPSQLNQVFMNVLVNAIQAISDLGTISLSTRTENESVVIEIQDDGQGIPESILPEIFNPFFTTRKVGEGTGLGLSISYGIIEKHNGEISFTSICEKGATCRIKLPIN